MGITRNHKSSTRSSLSLAGDSSRRVHTYARRTILTVILLAMITVVFGLFAAILNTPERVITRSIENLVQDYYENYFYDTVGLHSGPTANRTEILAGYEKTGFASVTLRQLLYFDDERHLDQRSSLEAYCDLSTTSVRIYPEPPYGRTDYRVDYRYDCNF